MKPERCNPIYSDHLFRLACAICLIALGSHVATAQLRVVTYNTANSGDGGPISPRAGMQTILEAIGNETRVGIARPIDVMALQEQNASATTTQDIVDLLNGLYGAGTYARSFVDANTFGAGRVGLIYNTTTVDLIASVPVGNVSGGGASRQPMRYQLRPAGYTSDADIFLYSNHYNATSPSRRLVEADFTRSNADSLGQGTNIIYAGDFNIDSSSESMYVELTSTGAGEAFDPLNTPGTWSGNSFVRALHTQSPYDSSFNDPSLIAGGMDDRFDFQLVSGEMNDNNGVSHIAGTYRSFGNNGSHSLNDAINDPSNTAAAPNVLDALASVSDHLPVVVDYRVPAIMQVDVPGIPNRAIVDSTATFDVDIYNAATPLVSQGADNLDYTIMGVNGILGSASGSDNALGNRPTHTFTLDTNGTGLRTAQLIAETTSQDVPVSQIIESVPFDVVLPAAPSFSPFADQLTLDLEFGIVAPDGNDESQQFAIVNRLQTANSANLDLDDFSMTGDDAFSSNLSVFDGLQPNGANVYDINLEVSTSGVFEATWEITVSDEDIPGEQQSTLTINATGCVALPGDANLDGIVDGLDFIIWNDNKFLNGTSFETGDFNLDGITDGLDFIVWNEFKFQSLGHQFTVVPEPQTGCLLALACLGLGIHGRYRNATN